MIVSIVIPIYNASHFIVGCLDSVANQTMTDGVECILIDDCGQDDSVQLIEDYIENYRGNISFRLFRQDCNLGPSAARNRGIQEARGEYVFFLDADDQLTQQCIEILYNLAKENNLDYVQGTYRGEQKFHDSQILDNKKEIKSLLLDYSKIQFTPHNRLVRRKMILEYNLFFCEQIRVREDFLWMTFVAKYVNRFAITPVETYIRGYNEGSLTHNINLEREILGFRVLIETMCSNFDSFLLGRQKELALDALLMCLRAGYYHDDAEKQHLICVVSRQNNIVENWLLNSYLYTNCSKIHHLLVKLYKLRDL